MIAVSAARTGFPKPGNQETMDQQSAPRRTDAIENAERVLTAALALYDERGLQAEMREIAARAGVGVGTVYRNFPTKDDLTNALVQQIFGQWRANLIEAEMAEDPLSALTQILMRQQELVRRHPWLAELQLRPQVLQEATMTGLADLASMQQATMERVVQRAIDRGDFRAGLDVPLVAVLFSVAGHPDVFERAGAGRSAHEMAEAVLALFQNGIGA